MKRTLICTLLCLLLAGCGGGGDDDRDETARVDRQPVDCQADVARCL